MIIYFLSVFVLTYIVNAQQLSPWVAFIKQGDRQVFWKEKVIVDLYVWNMDTDLSNTLLTNTTVTWNCVDLTLNKTCYRTDETQLVLDKFNYTVSIAESSLYPKRSYQFIAQIKGDYETNISVTLYFAQNIIPLLNITYPYSIYSRLINFDEFIDFNIQLDDGVSPDDSQISLTINLDGQVLKLQLLYPRLRFQASKYFPNYKNSQQIGNCRIRFVYSLQNCIDPAEYEIQFKINYPPSSGVLSAVLEGQVVNIAVNSESDTHTPLQYKYWLYVGQNINYQTINEQYELTDFLDTPTYQVGLPNGDFTIVCQVKDNYGAISEVYQNVSIISVKYDITTIATALQVEQSIPQIMSYAIILKGLYSQLSIAEKAQYAGTLNTTITNLSSFYDTQFALKTQEKYQVMCQKALYLLESSGAAFILPEDLDSKLQFLISFQTKIRKDIIKITIQIQDNEKLMIAGQQKGNFTAQQLYLELKSLYGVFGSVIDQTHDIFDIFLGRMAIDNPNTILEAQAINQTQQNSSDYLKELFMNLTDTNNKGRLLAQVEEKDLVSDDDYISSFQQNLIDQSILNLDHFELIHICYKRLISLVQVLNLIINNYCDTNGDVVYRNFKYFNITFRRSSTKFAFDYLEQDDYYISYFGQETLNSSQIPVFSGYWNLQNDTINFDVIIDDTNITGNENFAAKRNIYMWENRDTFANLSDITEYQINPNFLYLISIVTFAVNPYYWKSDVYEYAKWNQYSKNLKYVSPQFIIQNGSDYQLVLDFQHFQFKNTFSTTYSENNTRCGSILSNFTGDNCTKSVVGAFHSCKCKYLSDLILLEEYIPVDLREIQFVSVENLYLTVVGQTLGIMTCVMLIFMIFTAFLDCRSQKVVPVQHDVEVQFQNDEFKGFEKFSESKFKSSQILPEKSSLITIYKKEAERNMGKETSMDVQLKDESSLTIFSKHYRKGNNGNAAYEDVNNAAVQYEPVFKTNIELGIKYTTVDLVLTGIIKLHELMSIFLYYDNKLSRPSRILQVYMKLMVMFVVSSYTIEYLNQIEHILLIIFLGEISVFFLAIIKAELNGWLYEKFIGFLLTLALLGGCFIFYFYYVIGLQIDVADDWARQFLISYLSNHVLFDPVIVIFKILLYPWTLQQMVGKTNAPLAYLLNFLINHAGMRALYQL